MIEGTDGRYYLQAGAICIPGAQLGPQVHGAGTRLMLLPSTFCPTRILAPRRQARHAAR